jgi:transposase
MPSAAPRRTTAAAPTPRSDRHGRPGCNRSGHLHELFPGHTPKRRTLARAHALTSLERSLAPLAGPVALIARQLVVGIGQLTAAIDGLAREIAARVAVLAPALLGLQGCGALTAAKLLGETAGSARFRSPPPLPVTTAARPYRSGRAMPRTCA